MGKQYYLRIPYVEFARRLVISLLIGSAGRLCPERNSTRQFFPSEFLPFLKSHSNVPFKGAWYNVIKTLLSTDNFSVFSKHQAVKRKKEINVDIHIRFVYEKWKNMSAHGGLSVLNFVRNANLYNANFIK